jgi:HSP20 family protein
MPSLIRRNNEGGLRRPERSAETWDPFRMMREMMRWDPLQDVGYFGRGQDSFIPSFDVKETKDSYVFRADLPGVKEEDLDISLTGRELRISGHRQAEQHDEGDRFYASECSYGSFVRAFTLPDGTDAENVKAEMKNGILTLTVPKKPEVQPRRISLGKGDGNKGKA